MSSKCSCCCYEECFDVKDFVSVYFSSGNVLVPQWYTYNTWQWIVKWLNQRTNNRNKKNEPTSYKSKLWYFIFWWNRYFRWFVITRNGDRTMQLTTIGKSTHLRAVTFYQWMVVARRLLYCVMNHNWNVRPVVWICFCLCRLLITDICPTQLWLAHNLVQQ